MTTIGVRRGDGSQERSYSSSRMESDEEEPWDHPPPVRSCRKQQQPQQLSFALTESQDEEEEILLPLPGDSGFLEPNYDDSLEDGDLPALTRNSSKATAAGGQQQRSTTTRPLRAPSAAGATAAAPITPTDRAMQQQQKQFWSQLEVGDVDDEEDDDPAMEEREQRSYDLHQQGVSMVESEDGPEDEMIARKSDWLSSPRQPDETEEYALNTNSSGDNLDGDFCGVALTAIGNMCGAGFAVNSPDKKADPPGRLRHRTIMPEQQEEHTAIEVEFVDPTPAHADTLRQKNMLLSAIQRKTKDDSKTRDKPRTAPASASRDEDLALEDLDDSDDEPGELTTRAPSSDLYNSFSTSDKRKFLNLLNSGVSPADASTQILLERNKDKDGKGKGKDKASSKVMAKLAFWKKLAASSSAPQDKTSGSRALDRTPAQSVPEPEPEPLHDIESDEDNDNEPASYDEQVDMELQQNSTDPIEEMERLEAEQMAAIERFEEEKKNDSTPPRAVAVESAFSTPDSAISSASRPFAKSGIDYYDGVRSSPGNAEEDETSNAIINNAAKRVAALRSSMAFAKRAERAKSAPRSRLDDDDDEESLDRPRYPRSPADNDAESFNAGILATSAAQRQRALMAVSSKSGKIGESPSSVDSEAFGNLDRNRPRPISTEQASSSNIRASNLPVVTPDAATTIDKASADPGPQYGGAAFDIVPVSTATFDGLEQADSIEVKRPEPVIPNTKDGRVARAERFEPVVSKKPSSRPTIQLDSLDVNMSTYMNASDAYNTPSGMNVGGNHHDNVSVYTMGTTMTGMSTFTTSTRSRRPGAAKSRLEKEKLAQKVNRHKKGWHETMKAVSASTNRHWDPVRGWVDFEDRHDDIPEPAPTMMHLNLEKSIPHRRPEPESVPGNESAVSVPFPEKWESERQAMAGQLDARAATRAITLERTGYALEASAPTRSMESIQEDGGTDALEGTKWNDQTRGATDAEPAAAEVDATMSAAEPEGSRAVDDSAKIEDESTNILRATSKKLSKWVLKHEQPDSRDVGDTSAESSTMAIASTTDEQKYVQIESNGAVRSRTPPARFSPMSQVTSPVSNLRLNSRKYERMDETAALSSNSGSFPSLGVRSSPELVSPVTTNVVKQKIGVEDFDLFPEEKPTSSRLLETRVFHHEDAKSMASVSRRSVGPVDIDEIDPTWDEDEEEPVNTAVSWEGRSRDPPDNSSEVGSSIVASSSFGSKKIPKLRSNKRDTSPVNNRRHATIQESRSHQTQSASDLDDDGDEQRDVNWPYDLSSKRNASASSSYDEFFEVKDVEEAQRIEDAESIERERNLVKERLRQWESRGGLSDNGTPENALASEEWKSFLGKKASLQREAILGRRADPEGDRHAYRTKLARSGLQEMPSESDGSVFDHLTDRNMYQSRGGHASRTSISELSSIAKNDKSSDFEPATSEYGPSDGDKGSFFKRFVECTAPIRAECHTVGANVQTSVQDTVQEYRESDSMPMAHLAFLRTNSQAQGAKSGSSRFVPPAFCGRQDNVVVEEDGDEEGEEEDVKPTGAKDVRPIATAPPVSMSSSFNQRTKPPSSHGVTPRPRSHALSSSASSVVSADGFGAKTAYLEALALRGAVSGSKRSSSRPRGTRSSASSVTSGASSAHSEKWKSFLEKKKLRSGVSPGRSIANESDVSKAAERYASTKLEEMRSRRSEVDHSTRQAPVQPANELAAARVEAMVAALTSPNQLDEGEI